MSTPPVRSNDAAPESGNRCATCNVNNSDDARFCGNCGRALRKFSCLRIAGGVFFILLCFPVMLLMLIAAIMGMVQIAENSWSLLALPLTMLSSGIFLLFLCGGFAATLLYRRGGWSIWYPAMLAIAGSLVAGSVLYEPFVRPLLPAADQLAGRWRESEDSMPLDEELEGPPRIVKESFIIGNGQWAAQSRRFSNGTTKSRIFFWKPSNPYTLWPCIEIDPNGPDEMQAEVVDGELRLTNDEGETIYRREY